MKKLLALAALLFVASVAHHKVQRSFTLASDATTVKPDFGMGDDDDLDDGGECDDDDDYMLARN